MGCVGMPGELDDEDQGKSRMHWRFCNTPSRSKPLPQVPTSFLCHCKKRPLEIRAPRGPAIQARAPLCRGTASHPSVQR
eukprot:2476729-Pyramimonas_sp.AAC.1